MYIYICTCSFRDASAKLSFRDASTSFRACSDTHILTLLWLDEDYRILTIKKNGFHLGVENEGIIRFSGENDQENIKFGPFLWLNCSIQQASLEDIFFIINQIAKIGELLFEYDAWIASGSRSRLLTFRQSNKIAMDILQIDRLDMIRFFFVGYGFLHVPLIHWITTTYHIITCLNFNFYPLFATLRYWACFGYLQVEIICCYWEGGGAPWNVIVAKQTSTV